MGNLLHALQSKLESFIIKFIILTIAVWHFFLLSEILSCLKIVEKNEEKYINKKFVCKKKQVDILLLSEKFFGAGQKIRYSSILLM